MADMVTIGAVLSSVKTATEIARMLKDSDLSLEKAEVKLKLAELVSALADAKLEAAQVQELLLEKDRRIKELETTRDFSEKLVWKDPVYVLPKGNVEEPFCPQCHDSSQKAIRLQTPEPGHWECMTCKNHFFSQSYDPTWNSGDTILRGIRGTPYLIE